MCVMGRREEPKRQGARKRLGSVNGERDLQCYGDCEEPLFGRCVVRPLVNLFPQRQIVISTAVEVGLKGYTSDPMEHQVVELSPQY
jgi:hypothetical protein